MGLKGAIALLRCALRVLLVVGQCCRYPSEDRYMKKYSLMTLLLTTAIVALVVSQVVMMRSLGEAQQEVNAARKNFGHIKIDDPSLTYVCGIARNGNQVPISVRIVVPSGSRYVLHLTDTVFDDQTPTDSLPTTSTIVLNNWRSGADTLLSCEIKQESGIPVATVRAGEEELFHYKLKGWVDSGQMKESTFVSSDKQRSFTVDQIIEITRWRDPGTGRGIVVWLEPHARLIQRENKK